MTTSGARNDTLIIGAANYIIGLTQHIDGYSRVFHDLRADVTREPVTIGSDITDHAKPEPAKLQLTGHASNLDDPSRPETAWQALRALHRNPRPVTIVTEWGTYRNMLLAKAETSQTRRGMRIELEFREVIFVPPPPPPPPINFEFRDPRIVGGRSGSPYVGGVPFQFRDPTLVGGRSGSPYVDGDPTSQFTFRDPHEVGGRSGAPPPTGRGFPFSAVPPPGGHEAQQSSDLNTQADELLEQSREAQRTGNTFLARQLRNQAANLRVQATQLQQESNEIAATHEYETVTQPRFLSVHDYFTKWAGLYNVGSFEAAASYRTSTLNSLKTAEEKRIFENLTREHSALVEQRGRNTAGFVPYDSNLYNRVGYTYDLPD